MSSVLKKLFKTPDVVGKLTAKEYYDGFKKIFSKVTVSEGGDEEEDGDEVVPKGEPFFYVTDFAFADGEAPLLWVGNLSTEWKMYRKSQQNKSSFAKGYAEKASEENPDEDGRAYTFTITDGKALKETACKAVEKTVQKYCSKKINVTVPQVAEDTEQPIATPEKPEKVKKDSEAFNSILASFNFYKNIDGLKAPAAKIKARLDLENLVEVWDAKKEPKALTEQVQKLKLSLDGNLQWQEQMQDLANELKQNELAWAKALAALGGDIQKLKNVIDPKEQRKHYLAIRHILSETISFQLKKSYYFDDEIKAGTLSEPLKTQLQNLLVKNKAVEDNCNNSLKLLTEENPNAAKLEQAYRDLSPKDDIRMARLNIFPAGETTVPKKLNDKLNEFKKLLAKTGNKPNPHANELQTALLGLSDYMNKHQEEIPVELRKEIGDKIYEARREIGLSGHLDSNYIDIVQLFENFEERKKDFLEKWGLGQKEKNDEEIQEKSAQRQNIKSIIGNLENKMRLWESAQADFSSIEIQEQSKGIRRMRRAMAELSALNLGISYTMPEGVARKTYVLEDDKKYKADELTTFKTTSDDFIKNAIFTNKTVSWAQFKIATGKAMPNDAAKIDAVEARIKKLHKKLEGIVSWQVEAKKYDTNPDLVKAKKHFSDLEALIDKELKELQSARQAIFIDKNASINAEKLERVQKSRGELEKKLEELKRKEKLKPAKGRPQKMANLETQINQRSIRINNLQNRIAQGGAAFNMQAKSFVDFTPEEIEALKAIVIRWHNFDVKAPKEADAIVNPKGKTVNSVQELESILEIQDTKVKVMEATKRKSDEAVKKANSDLENDYNLLAYRLTNALTNHDEEKPQATIALIQKLQKDVIARMPDSETIQQSNEQLGLDYYAKLKNLNWHCKRLLKELTDEDTLDKITANKIMQEVGYLINVKEDDPSLVPDAVAMIEAIDKWQSRNTPAKDSKEIWTLPKTKNLYGSLTIFKEELVSKLSKVETVMSVKPSLLPILNKCSSEIKFMLKAMNDARSHPTVKQWIEILNAEQAKFDNKKINILTPNLQEELDKINLTVEKIRVAYFKIEDDLYRKEEERAFAAFKGGFDVVKNKGFIVPDKEIPVLNKIYERIINRVDARIKNGEAPEEIQASLAHIPFNFIPDKCIANLAAWQATRKAVLERHFSMNSKDHSAEGYVSTELQEMPTETLAQINQKARDFVEAEEFKKLVSDLADKSPEELDEYIKEKELAKDDRGTTLDSANDKLQTAVNISLIAAKVLQKMVQAAQLTSKATGKIDDKTNNLIGNNIAPNMVNGSYVNDALSVAKILGGVSSILSGVIQAISLLKTEPKTNPQTTFDKIVRKSLTALESLGNTGYGITVILDALQFGVGEILIGFNLAIDLINVAKALYNLIQHTRMAIKTGELEEVASLEDNPLAMAFQQEIKSLDAKITKDAFLLATSTTAAIGSATQLAGLADPTGGTMLAGQVIRWTAKGVEVGGNIVLAVKNVMDVRKAAKWIKKAAVGDREAQIKVMSNCSYYAKMYIAHKAFEGDPLAKKYLIDRNMGATDLENEFTAKSVLQDALLYASEEGGDTFWFNPADGELTSINAKLFEDFKNKVQETYTSVVAKTKLFFGTTPTQTYEQLQTMGLVSKTGLHGLFANYLKFKSKKINALHPIRAYHSGEFTRNLKALYLPVKNYHNVLLQNIANVTKTGSLAEINHSTKCVEYIEQEANEIERILQLFEMHQLAA